VENINARQSGEFATALRREACGNARRKAPLGRDIRVTGAKGVEAPSVDGPSSFTAKVQALVTLTAKVPPAVQKTERIGWAKLERQGIAL
jgi:hypothetical protein